MASDAWQYFTIDLHDPNYAKCNLCQKLLSRGGDSKSTSNMKNHLKKVHHIGDGKSSQKKPVTFKPAKLRDSLQAFLHKSTKPTTSTLTTSELSGPSTSSDTQFGHIFEPPLGQESDDLVDDPGSLQTLDLPTPLTVQIPPPVSNFVVAEDPLSSPEISTQMSSSDQSAIDSSASSISPGLSLYPKTIKKRKTPGAQMTLPQIADRMTKFKSTDSRAIAITTLIARMICKDLQPISIVQNDGFRKLLAHLEPRYIIPTRKTFAKFILVQMYEEELNKLRRELMDVEFVAVTTDMWTSIANTDFMAVSVHYFNKTANVAQHKCLEVKPFTEVSHTANNLKDFLLSVFEEWSIVNKVVAIVRDNGPDITAAVERSAFEAVPCLAHTLQLVLKDGFLDNSKISNVVKKCKKVVGSFKHSAKNTKILKSVQKQLGLKLHAMIQEEPTRWNTTFYMLRRMLEQKDAIVLISSKNEIKLAAEITNEDWATIEFAVNMLQIFEKATLQVSKESSTIAEIIPTVNTILQVLERMELDGSGLKGLRNDILASMKRRFSNFETKSLYAVATVLDPRFKSTPFLNRNNFEAAKEKLIQELKISFPQIETTTTDAPPSQQHSSNESLPKRTKASDSFWSHYNEAFSIQNESTRDEPGKSYEEEVDAYLKEKLLDSKLGNEVGNYWRLSSFHRLKSLSTKYLCVPPSTVYSERLFSTAGNICDAKRNRLDPEKVKMLVFLKTNLD